MADEEETEDLAADAFDDLRDEVAALRAVIEQLPKRFRVAKGPDYTPTLKAMSSALKAMLQALQRIETHPALLVTPDRYGAELMSAVQSVRQRFEGELNGTLRSIHDASNVIDGYGRGLRGREAQRKAVIYAAAGGLCAGVVLWAIVAGPIARAFPMSWRVPEQMAAATLNVDRWAAGSRLMQSADPAAWKKVLIASRLWSDNQKALEVCLRAADKEQKAQSCKVIVDRTQKPAPESR